MRGGSLIRYHTPVVTTQEGKGLAEELIKIAGPLIVQQAQAGLPRYTTRTEFGRHLVQSRRATHTRPETQSSRPGLDGQKKPSQTPREKHL